ncbi:MAG: hypothetical protein QG622_3176 [Actinomycetota bacterium]|nr:hypothetical protein [Actinomycetota bacterium]
MGFEVFRSAPAGHNNGITSTTRPDARPQITLPSGPTLALCDAIVSIDPEKRLGEYVNGLTVAEMQEIDQAMKFFLDLA